MAYSHSKLQAYLTCPLKYRYEKIDKLDVVQEGIFESMALVLGSSVHNALEYLYKLVRNKLKIEKSQLIWYFHTARKQEMEVLDTKYDKQVFPPAEQEVAIDRGVGYLNRYFDTYSPFDQAITDSVEKSSWIDLKKGVKFVGKVDRLDIQGETAIIVDYKTSRTLPKDEDDVTKNQLAIYGLGIQHDYGDKFKRIVWKVIYLHLEREYTRELTDDVIQATKQKYLEVVEEIEHKTFYYNMGDEAAFEPRAGRHCEECPFQALCPIYKHKFATNESVSLGELWEKTIKGLIDEVYELGVRSKELEAKKSLYLELLRKYAEEQGYTHRLWGTEAKLRLDKKDEYVPIKETKDDLIEKLKLKGVWDEVKKEDIDKKTFDTLFHNQKLSASEFQGLVRHETRLTVGWPTKMSDKEIEEGEGEIGR